MIRNPEAAARITAALGPIPPSVDVLRRVRRIIDSETVYKAMLANGHVITESGAAILETVDAVLALADAQEAGDELALKRAVLRLLAL